MPESTSFDDAARVVYRGSRGIEILLDPKTVDYSPRKRLEMPESTSFDDVARVLYRGSLGIEILPGPQKPWNIAHKNDHKCLKSRVLTMPLESCTGGHGDRNPPGTRKPWTIDHENGQKCLKSRVLMMPLESCTGGHGASKFSRAPKNMDCSP